MAKFGERLKGVLKSSGELVRSLLGIDDFKKSEQGKKLTDEAKKTGNSLFSAFGLGTPFQTEEMKQEAERRAQQQERDNIAAMAESSSQIAELLRELNGKL